jgi:hypothetical protein
MNFTEKSQGNEYWSLKVGMFLKGKTGFYRTFQFFRNRMIPKNIQKKMLMTRGSQIAMIPNMYVLSFKAKKLFNFKI